MIFPFAASIVTVLAFGQAAFALVTPAQVVSTLTEVTTISSNANAALTPLPSGTRDFSPVRDSAQSLIQSLQSLGQKLNSATSSASGTQVFTDAQATPVVAALGNFATAQRSLLQTVIGKHPVFAQYGATAPITAALRELEASIDAFTFNLVNLAPTKASQVQEKADSLNQFLGEAIRVYQQLCIPSPLFPTIRPICVPI